MLVRVEGEADGDQAAAAGYGSAAERGGGQAAEGHCMAAEIQGDFLT